VNALLSHLAVELKLHSETQKQALAVLPFSYRVLASELLDAGGKSPAASKGLVRGLQVGGVPIAAALIGRG
jgi:hypothetical protein